jgi:hypothetical protein
MSSERRIRASQANGAKSHGPKTEEGKRRSSQNATRHGLLASNVVLSLEDASSFEALLTSFETALQPTDDFSRTLVENMAIARWRTLRVLAMETATFEHAIAKIDNPGPNPAEQTDPPTKAALALQNLCGGSAPAVNLLHRYEVRYDRQFSRAFTMFLKWRAESNNNPPAQDLPSEPNPKIEHSPAAPEPAPETQPAPKKPTSPNPHGATTFKKHIPQTSEPQMQPQNRSAAATNPSSY